MNELNYSPTDVSHPFNELFDRYDVLKPNTDTHFWSYENKVLAKKRDRNLAYMLSERVILSESTCFVPDRNVINVATKPFHLKHIVIGHPLASEFAMKREHAPATVTLTVRYKLANNAITDSEPFTYTLQFDLDGAKF